MSNPANSKKPKNKSGSLKSWQRGSKFGAVNTHLKEFPSCVREALAKIESLLCTSKGMGREYYIAHENRAMEMISELVFFEGPPSLSKKKLNFIQELQLMEILCDYFAICVSRNGEAVANAVFSALFPPTQIDRHRLLLQLVSLAMSLKNNAILACAAVLMQQIGCTTQFSVTLAEGIANSHIALLQNAETVLRDLPHVATLFTCNFLTAITEVYGSVEKEGSFIPPPETLLKVITSWVSDNPSLCLAAMITNLKSALPLGGIPMPAITPYAGLIKWCVMSALYPKRESDLYWRLHLAVIKSLHEETRYLRRKDIVISAQHLAAIVPPLLSRIEEEDCLTRIELAVDRFVQAVQIGISANVIFGRKQDFFHQLEKLPETKLLRIVLSSHQGSICHVADDPLPLLQPHYTLSP